MDFPWHHGCQGLINQAVTLDHRLPGEGGGDDPHREMPCAVAGTCVVCVKSTVVANVERLRRQRGVHELAHALHPRGVHGRTCLNGRTSQCSNTPSVT